MRISEAKKCIIELYKNTDCVTALVSERGVGKTAAYKQCAEELGIGYMGLYAAAMEGPDFMGLPDKDREKGITRYLAPQFLPTAATVGEGLFPENGLLILEEINRVPSDTVSVLYPLLLERKINGHSLAPGWKIGVTMNPDTLNYAVSSLDDAMLDRFVSIEITPNLEDYIDYSLHHRPCDDVLAYLTACPDMLLRIKKAAESTALAKSPTPRGWTRVQELLNTCSLPDKLTEELVSGILGPETAASFFGYRKSKACAIPAADVLLADYGAVRPLMNKLVADGRLDLISLVLKRVVTLAHGSDAQCENLDRMLSDLPEELQLLFFKTLVMGKPELFLTVAERTAAFNGLSDQIIKLLA